MLRKTVLVRALALAFSAGAMSTMVVAPVMAQSNAAGTIFGKIDAGAGDSVVLKNTDTNAARTSAVDANGAFRVTSLPIGNYTVTLMKGQAVVGTTSLEVLAGQGVEATFPSAGATEYERGGMPHHDAVLSVISSPK